MLDFKTYKKTAKKQLKGGKYTRQWPQVQANDEIKFIY